jgi:hypothetical protein
MPLHLIKLAVGAESLADLREWMAERMAEAKRRRGPLRHAHITRMAPKRAEQILDGGSLYWVVKGLISARQEIVGLVRLLLAVAKARVHSGQRNDIAHALGFGKELLVVA